MRLSTVLNHAIRRDILRVLHASEQPSSMTAILSELPSLKRSEVRYHLQVLEGGGAVIGAEKLSARSDRSPYFRSAVVEDPEAQAVLQAMEQEDDRRRQEAEANRSSGLLTMFRLPRLDRTIHLGKLLGRKRDPEK